MPFILIKGMFFPSVGEPDGDSVRFAADDISLWDRLDGRVDDPGTKDTLQLRFEGIDAIEKKAIQPLATQALNSMLELIGSSPNTKQEARGYILSRAAEGNGRPVAFAFAGNAPEADGAEVFLDAKRLEDSVNYQQVKAGFAYPLYYNTLFRELREKLNEAVEHARSLKLGYWKTDATLTGVTINSRAQLSSIPPIWPKLWRRLDEFLRSRSGLNGFLTFIRNTKERADDLTKFEQHTLDNFMTVNGDNVRLNLDPKHIRVVSR